MASDDFEFILDAECGLAHYRETILSVWKGMPTVSLVDAHFTLARKLVTRYGRTAMLIVIEQDAPPPHAEARGYIERFYAQLGRQLACVAQVIEGSGFGPSAARAVVSTMNLVVQRSYPIKVFAKTTLAMPWMVDSLGMSDAEALEHGMRLAASLSRVRARQEWKRPQRDSIRRRISLAPPR